MWGGTSAPQITKKGYKISIHPPLVGWDPYHQLVLILYKHFNPPTPCGVGLNFPPDSVLLVDISIHPPLVGWDKPERPLMARTTNFNPPTPCGVGHLSNVATRSFSLFQSTHPLWGGTLVGGDIVQLLDISIHPPLVGWDSVFSVVCFPAIISIHPPLVGWDFSA